MGVITLWLFAGACFGAEQPDWYGKVTPVLIITDVLAMVLAANFGCKRTNLTEEEKAALEQLSKDPAQKRRERNLKEEVCFLPWLVSGRQRSSCLPETCRSVWKMRSF